MAGAAVSGAGAAADAGTAAASAATGEPGRAVTAGRTTIWRRISTASSPLRRMIRPSNGARRASKSSRQAVNDGHPAGSSPKRAQPARHWRWKRRTSAVSAATRAGSAPAAASSTSSAIARSSHGPMTVAWFTDSVTRIRAGPSSTVVAGARPSIIAHRGAEPTVSTTRWMRDSPAGFTTLCVRQVSKTQTSPGAMWTSSSPQ